MGTTVAVRERPILFSRPMVRAILAGRKTQTRRVVKVRRFDPAGRDCDGRGEWCTVEPGDGWTPELIARHYPCPYGAPGDRLWVRETFIDMRVPDYPPRDLGVLYAADCPPGTPAGVKGGWRPSIFMPRDCSRLALDVTGVRVERVQDISHPDIAAEGVGLYNEVRQGPFYYGQDVAEYRRLWDSLNARRGYGWDTNPWVFVIEFQRREDA